MYTFNFLSAKPASLSQFGNFGVPLDAFILWDPVKEYRQGMHKYGCTNNALKNDKGGTYSKLPQLVSE